MQKKRKFIQAIGSENKIKINIKEACKPIELDWLKNLIISGEFRIRHIIYYTHLRKNNETHDYYLEPAKENRRNKYINWTDIFDDESVIHTYTKGIQLQDVFEAVLLAYATTKRKLAHSETALGVLDEMYGLHTNYSLGPENLCDLFDKFLLQYPLKHEFPLLKEIPADLHVERIAWKSQDCEYLQPLLGNTTSPSRQDGAARLRKTAGFGRPWDHELSY